MARKGMHVVAIAGISIFLFLATYTVSVAQGLVPCGNDPSQMCTWSQLIGGSGSLISNVINFALFGFAVPIAVGFFIWGGIKMVTSGGNEGRFKEGKTVVTGVLWGLAIAFGAWLIVNTVINILTG